MNGLYAEQIACGCWQKYEAEIERLRAALIRFADRSNWYFEGDHMCPEWMGKTLPWEEARNALGEKSVESERPTIENPDGTRIS